MNDEHSSTLIAVTFGLALLLMAGLLALMAAVAPSNADPADRVGFGSGLLSELRDGGEVLLFRHATTDRSVSDLDPTARGTCEQQRNLSSEGVAQARGVGNAMRDLGLEVSAVYASPFCRTVDTAEAFGLGDVVTTDALLSTTAALDESGVDRILEEATTLIREEIGGDALVVMVTHTQNIEALTSLTVEEGDAVVLSASGQVLAVVPAEDWG